MGYLLAPSTSYGRAGPQSGQQPHLPSCQRRADKALPGKHCDDLRPCWPETTTTTDSFGLRLFWMPGSLGPKSMFLKYPQKSLSHPESELYLDKMRPYDHTSTTGEKPEVKISTLPLSTMFSDFQIIEPFLRKKTATSGSQGGSPILTTTTSRCSLTAPNKHLLASDSDWREEGESDLASGSSVSHGETELACINYGKMYQLVTRARHSETFLGVGARKPSPSTSR